MKTLISLGAISRNPLLMGEHKSEIDAQTVREELRAAQGCLEKVPAKIRQLITLPAFPEAICRLFQKAA